MNRPRRAIRRSAGRLAFLLLLALPWLTAPEVAFAYLDPGTGSILLQALIGGVAGLGVILKLYWHRLRGLIGGRKKAAREERSSAVE